GRRAARTARSGLVSGILRAFKPPVELFTTCCASRDNGSAATAPRPFTSGGHRSLYLLRREPAKPSLIDGLGLLRPPLRRAFREAAGLIDDEPRRSVRRPAIQPVLPDPHAHHVGLDDIGHRPLAVPYLGQVLLRHAALQRLVQQEHHVCLLLKRTRLLQG